MVLAVGISLAWCYVTVDIRNDHIDVDYQLSLEQGQASARAERNKADGTYVEDLKDPHQVRLPCPNRLFIILCVHKPGKYIPSAFLGDLLFDLLHSSAITKSSVSY